jgi:hypothetical protein
VEELARRWREDRVQLERAMDEERALFEERRQDLVQEMATLRAAWAEATARADVSSKEVRPAGTMGMSGLAPRVSLLLCQCEVDGVEGVSGGGGGRSVVLWGLKVGGWLRTPHCCRPQMANLPPSPPLPTHAVPMNMCPRPS